MGKNGTAPKGTERFSTGNLFDGDSGQTVGAPTSSVNFLNVLSESQIGAQRSDKNAQPGAVIPPERPQTSTTAPVRQADRESLPAALQTKLPTVELVNNAAPAQKTTEIVNVQRTPVQQQPASDALAKGTVGNTVVETRQNNQTAINTTDKLQMNDKAPAAPANPASAASKAADAPAMTTATNTQPVDNTSKKFPDSQQYLANAADRVAARSAELREQPSREASRDVMARDSRDGKAEIARDQREVRETVSKQSVAEISKPSMAEGSKPVPDVNKHPVAEANKQPVADRTIRNDERAIRSDERKIRNDERAIRSDERAVRNDERAVRNDERAVRNDDRAIRSDDRAVRNDERALRNDERAVRNAERAIRTDERAIRNDERSTRNDVRNEDRCIRNTERGVRLDERTVRSEGNTMKNADGIRRIDGTTITEADRKQTIKEIDRRINDLIERAGNFTDKTQSGKLANPEMRRALADLIDRFRGGEMPAAGPNQKQVIRAIRELGPEGMKELRDRLINKPVNEKFYEGLEPEKARKFHRFLDTVIKSYTEKEKQNNAPEKSRTEVLKDLLADQVDRAKHIVQKGQSLAWIAWNYFNEAKVWPVIAKVNGFPTTADKTGKPVFEPKVGQTVLLPRKQEVESFKNTQRQEKETPVAKAQSNPLIDILAGFMTQKEKMIGVAPKQEVKQEKQPANNIVRVAERFAVTSCKLCGKAHRVQSQCEMFVPEIVTKQGSGYNTRVIKADFANTENTRAARDTRPVLASNDQTSTRRMPRAN